MKINKVLPVILLLIFAGFISAKNNSNMQANSLNGAWQLTTSGQQMGTTMRIVSDNFFMETHYDLSGKKFISSRGGTYTLQNGIYQETIEFDTADSTKVGTKTSAAVKLSQGKWNSIDKQTKTEQIWTRIQEPALGQSPLAGAWRITGREQNGAMATMQQGPRKTIKLLSGSRFQWAAFNTATKQFSGTGGGTYTAKEGKYTETIEFFSRDGNRVGASLSFQYEVKGKDWHHSGLSSTGNKIYEIWTKQ